MTLPIENDKQLKVARDAVRGFYDHIRDLRTIGPEAMTKEKLDPRMIDLEVEACLNQAKELKEEIKKYKAKRPPSQYMEVKHRHLLNESDRMVIKFAHILEETLARKERRVYETYKAVCDGKLLGVRDKEPRVLQAQLLTLENVIRAVSQARQRFTSDAVRYHTTRLKERLEVGARPKAKQR